MEVLEDGTRIQYSINADLLFPLTHNYLLSLLLGMMSSLPQLQLVTRYALLCFYISLSYTTIIPMVYVNADVANCDAGYGDLHHFSFQSFYHSLPYRTNASCFFYFLFYHGKSLLTRPIITYPCQVVILDYPMA